MTIPDNKTLARDVDKAVKLLVCVVLVGSVFGACLEQRVHNLEVQMLSLGDTPSSTVDTDP